MLEASSSSSSSSASSYTSSLWSSNCAIGPSHPHIPSASCMYTTHGYILRKRFQQALKSETRVTHLLTWGDLVCNTRVHLVLIITLSHRIRLQYCSQASEDLTKVQYWLPIRLTFIHQPNIELLEPQPLQSTVNFSSPSQVIHYWACTPAVLPPPFPQTSLKLLAVEFAHAFVSPPFMVSTSNTKSPSPSCSALMGRRVFSRRMHSLAWSECHD